MNKSRLDQELVRRGLVATRSQAESYIKLGKVKVDKKLVSKPGFLVGEQNIVELNAPNQYVSRAGLKLASIAKDFELNFKDKIVLDVGSSTGGFTDYALQNGAKKVVAVELGKNQMHPSLRSDPRIELYEQTDIRSIKKLDSKPNIIVIDVSFISLREILPYLIKLSNKKTEIIAMVKPQFEAKTSNIKHKGVIKNENIRREILKDFENWAKEIFVILNKKDSEITGEKGNKERFFHLKTV